MIDPQKTDMMKLVKKINRYPIMVLLLFVFADNTVGQIINHGGYHQLIIFKSNQFVTDNHVDLLSARIDMKGLNWTYSDNNTDQFKSITLSYTYGNNDNIRSSAFLIEYKNAYLLGKDKPQKFSNYTGYIFKTNSQVINSSGKHSWVGLNTLSIYNSMKYSWERNAISIEVSIPVAGFISRPEPGKEYQGSVNSMLYNSLSNTVFTSFHNHKEINSSIIYMRTITRKLTFTAGVSFSDQKIQTGNNFEKTVLQSQIGLSYFY